MDRMIYRCCFKPEYRYSGFFVFLLIVMLSGTAGQQPSELVTGLLWEAPDLLSRCTAPLDTAAPSTSVFISGSYDDLYRSVITGKNGSGTVLDKTELYSPRGKAGIITEQKSWGGGAWVRAGMVEAHRSGQDRDYSVDAAVPLSNLSLAGWTRKGRVRLLIGLGYDAGLPLDYRGFSNSSLIDSIGNVFKDPRFTRLFAGTLVLPNMSLTLYETKHPLVNASARVERTSNHAFVEIPLAAVTHEAGARAMVSAGRNNSAFTGAYMAIASDTAITGENILPAGLSGKGLRSGFCLSLGEVPFAPAAEINCWSQRVKARGYDYSDSAPYCWLDSNKVLFVNGQVSADAPWKLRVGLFGEYLAGASKNFGRFDPYVFSGFTFFDPVKYRIDTIDISYRAAGLFLERSFGVFRRDSAGVTIVMSYVRSSGFANTREYDFVLWTLVNPETHTLLDEEMILFSPEVRYTFLLRNFSCTATLRQLVPVSLKGGGGQGGVSDETSVSRSVRGGTAVRLDAAYRW